MAEFVSSDSTGSQSEEKEPEKRIIHESALVDGCLYLFGGWNESKYFNRDAIWIVNVRVAASERKWLCHLARGPTIPPPCIGARCVVIDKMIYSYGGEKKGGSYLGIVYRLDPMKMEWIEVATPVGGKKPAPRSFCCFCAIGSRMIMYGGKSNKISQDQLQSGATQKGFYNNEIYEFQFEEGNEREMWLDLELSGTRPAPLLAAAMATIDQHRAFLLGMDRSSQSHSFMLNLQNKSWTIIDFDVNPSPRWGHTICQLVKEGLEEKSLCLLVGGRNISASESVYVLDIDDKKAYQMDVSQQFQKLCYHTSHCVQNDDKTTEVLVYHWGLKCLHLDSRNELYMKIERELRSSMKAIERPSQIGNHEMERIERELQHLRRQCAQLEEEVESSAAEKRLCEEQAAQMRRQLEARTNEISTIREEFDQNERRFAEENASIRRQLEQRTRELVSATEAQTQLREENAVAVRRCETLQASHEEMKNSLDQFLDVLSVNPDDLHVTEQNLGSGAFAGVCIGLWRGMRVAVKKFHEIITNPRNLELFRREVLVCSRLHHPNIMTICGAVMEEGTPFQMVMELLEGSVSEVMNAAHAASGASVGSSYLTFFEQLSIAMDVTSAIAYLHQTRPKAYVHGDIRPSNVLVTRDMKAKVGDLGAAHIIESSLSVGPMSLDYLAAERMPRADGTAIPNSLPSDVYSLGVALIEIFTGARPIPTERQTQLLSLEARPSLFLLCSEMIDQNPDKRPSSQNCFDRLNAESERVLGIPGVFTGKRFVKGLFKRGNHRVVLFMGLNTV
ncbi:uncharacterized protein [Oscarella lobularis]|uniref:uncharacterized protein isoform X2 n=1 Tax=Oscarella lobularis TaxID=121494 RepID=UPI00331342B9